MDNTIDKSCFEKIYETKFAWIGRLAAGDYEWFYLIVSDQRSVSNMIAIEITKSDVHKIIDSNGDIKVVDSIARDLSNGYLYVK